ncbi:hypothetical protein D3C77_305640 [compost metagenome]
MDIILIKLAGVSRNIATAMQLSHVDNKISLCPVKYTERIDEPSSIPKPTAHFFPSRTMPASIPAKASKLI